jgi:hypothetical protein
MATKAGSQQWSPYPHIPIYLETYDANGATTSHNSISPVSPEFGPRDGAVHTLAAASTQYIRPVSPAASQFTNLSPIWPIPEPPHTLSRHQASRPALQFFPTSRTQHQFARPRLEPQSISNSHYQEPTNLGLGTEISTGSSHTTLAMPPVHGRGERSSNIAQTIEQKLWRYNSSRNVIKRWLLEIISWWISALCMGAIIGLSVHYRDGRIPNWPGNLTLNALIAILSKVSGAALLLPVSEALGQLKWSWFQDDSKKMWDFEIFDNASRGPWGSILLLIRTKGRALAALGALVTLFSLALDPFFQQVIDFPERWTLQKSNSSIPRIVHYNPSYGFELRAGNEVVENDPDTATVVQKFFYGNGTQPIAFGNGTRPDIPLTCPSSKCTWPVYETLGVCSECVAMDVPESLTWACLPMRVDWTSDLQGFDYADTWPNGTMCGYFLNATSDSPTFMSGYMVDKNTTKGEALLMRTLPLITNTHREALYGNGSINFKHYRNPIVDFLIVGANQGKASVYAGELPTMHECVISWCVKTIESSYYGGMYKEKVVNTFINTTNGDFPWVTVPFESDDFNGTLVSYLQEVSLDPDDNNASTFGVSNDTMFNTVAIFDDFFPSFATVQNDSADTMLRYKTYRKDSITRKFPINPWTLPNNVTQHMDRLATALTNVIRSSTVSNSTVLGKAYSMENYVSVRWEWLTLPLSLLFLGLFFLIATVRKTAVEEGQVGVWKTSAIATLLYGLPAEMQRSMTQDTQQGTPRAKAKKLKVKLHPGTGWRVSGNMFTPAIPNVTKNQPPPGWI